MTKKRKHDEHEAVAALLKSFEASLPHPEASMHGRYHFKTDDAWSGAKLEGAEDGWYTDGAWSVSIVGGKPIEAVRADVEEAPEDAHKVAPDARND